MITVSNVLCVCDGLDIIIIIIMLLWNLTNDYLLNDVLQYFRRFIRDKAGEGFRMWSGAITHPIMAARGPLSQKFSEIEC